MKRRSSRKKAQEAQKIKEKQKINQKMSEGKIDLSILTTEESGEKSDIFKLCDLIRETSFEIHRYHRQGHLEKIYENALAHRLSKLGIQVEQQYRLNVLDEDGTILGNYAADLFVENRLIIEIKACQNLHEEHIAQLLGYLRSSRIEHGLLINFGSSKLQIKKYILGM